MAFLPVSSIRGVVVRPGAAGPRCYRRAPPTPARRGTPPDRGLPGGCGEGRGALARRDPSDIAGGDGRRPESLADQPDAERQLPEELRDRGEGRPRGDLLVESEEHG